MEIDMNPQFWKVAHHELKNRLNHHDEFCEPDCQVCSALTIIMEDKFLKKAEKRHKVSHYWRVLLLKITDEMFGEETTNENILDAMYFLFNWEATASDWVLVNLYYGGNDGHCYSTKKIAHIFATEQCVVWQNICRISQEIRASLNSH
jgi:hypothetical protein